MIKHIAFDFDGTLGTAKNLSIKTLEHIYKKILHSDAPIDKFRTLTGMTVKEKLHFLDSIHGDILYEEWGKFYKEHFLDYLEGYDGLAEPLHALYGNDIDIIVLSNKKVEFIRMGLEKFGILKYFGPIYGVDNLPETKPSSQAVSYILEQNNWKQDEFMLVGDSIIDYECCKNANIQFGLANWCGKDLSKIIEMKPDYIFNSPLDILNL